MQLRARIEWYAVSTWKKNTNEFKMIILIYTSINYTHQVGMIRNVFFLLSFSIVTHNDWVLISAFVINLQYDMYKYVN